MPASAQITEIKLTASDAAAGDLFGVIVSISGNTAVVGAEHDDDAGTDSGSAYVFVRSGATWTQQAKLTASDAAAGDLFGLPVFISGDTVVVGAPHDDDAGDRSGSAYVFVRSGSSWSQQAKLLASDGAARDGFGRWVAIDGDTALIGAPNDDDAGSLSGSAYVFVRSGTTWTEQAKLTASDGASIDFFSFSVSVSGDTALIGAFLDDDAGTNSGSAYVFVRSGTTWTQQAKLTASDATRGDEFGLQVSLSGDTALVGAADDDDACLPIVVAFCESGSAYVFVRSGTTWTEQAKLTASDAARGDFFGRWVSIDGDNAVVGAVFDDDTETDSGSAYVFVRSGTTWTEQAKLTASDAAADDFFGHSVSVSGGTVIVGAHLDDDDGTDSGSAYVFSLEATFLLIDADSIDNGNAPNFFSAAEVNDNIADVGLRAQLPFFAANIGSTIALHTGTVGGEGWFAPKTIPTSWDAAGPTPEGLRNYLLAGPGLGTPDTNGDHEALLDKIPDVTPLRATGLSELEGRTVCAVVYDGVIGINYDPLEGSLKGANLGRVGFRVLSVTDLTGFSSSSLPQVEIEILDANEVCEGPVGLFTEAPESVSSSEPFDVSVKDEDN